MPTCSCECVCVCVWVGVQILNASKPEDKKAFNALIQLCNGKVCSAPTHICGVFVCLAVLSFDPCVHSAARPQDYAAFEAAMLELAENRLQLFIKPFDKKTEKCVCVRVCVRVCACVCACLCLVRSLSHKWRCPPVQERGRGPPHQPAAARGEFVRLGKPWPRAHCCCHFGMCAHLVCGLLVCPHVRVRVRACVRVRVHLCWFSAFRNAHSIALCVGWYVLCFFGCVCACACCSCLRRSAGNACTHMGAASHNSSQLLSLTWTRTRSSRSAKPNMR